MNTGFHFIESVIYYLFNTVEEKKKDEAFKIIDETLKEGGKTMTIAQSLRREGKIEGKIEGKREKAIETAKRMIENGFEITMISKITGLSIKEIEELNIK